MTWDQKVGVSTRLPADKDLGTGSIDQTVREVLWLVADGEENWDKGYSLFLYYLLRIEHGTMAQRVGRALDTVMVKLVEDHPERETRLNAACDRRHEIGGEVPPPDYRVKGMPDRFYLSDAAPRPKVPPSESAPSAYRQPDVTHPGVGPDGLTRSERDEIDAVRQREYEIREAERIRMEYRRTHGSR
jgi:hypothetical protein